MLDTFYIDRDPRPRTKPCHFCARDVEAGRTCTCVPAQPRSVPLTLHSYESYAQAAARAKR